jgi:P-type E1-E2 ATPase
MASITKMPPENCLLIRNGDQTSALAIDVVPGDILAIKAGNKLPADMRFIEISSDAKFDLSILTGESLPESPYRFPALPIQLITATWKPGASVCKEPTALQEAAKVLL